MCGAFIMLVCMAHAQVHTLGDAHMPSRMQTNSV